MKSAGQFYNKQHRQRTYKIEARSRYQLCRRKGMSIIYSECVSVALVIQHATRIRRIVLSVVSCVAVPYFSTRSH